jgi:hypothetical protein
MGTSPHEQETSAGVVGYGSQSGAPPSSKLEYELIAPQRSAQLGVGPEPKDLSKSLKQMRGDRAPLLRDTLLPL